MWPKAPIALLFVCGTITSTPLAGGAVRLIGGLTERSETVWSPVEEQGMMGIAGIFDIGESPWRLAFEIRQSRDKKHTLTPAPVFTVTFEGKSEEFSAGVMRAWRKASRLRPYVGAGLILGTAKLSAVDNDFEGGRKEDRDRFAGIYESGGVLWYPVERFSVGLELGLRQASRIDFLDASGRAGGAQASLSAGWDW
jgi:hypothetical protein